MTARQHRRGTVLIAECCAWDAVSALSFITDPARWPAFTAWAEQLEPSEPLTEDDRQRMQLSARYFLEFAEQARAMLGGPPMDEPVFERDDCTCDHFGCTAGPSEHDGKFGCTSQDCGCVAVWRQP